MAGWILIVGADSSENWALGRGDGIWATKKSRPFKTGDDLFFWQAGSGLIATAVALSDSLSSAEYDYRSLPWPDRWGFREQVRENEIYKSIVEMRVLKETSPLSFSWNEVRDALDFRTGANAAPVQLDDQASSVAKAWFDTGFGHDQPDIEMT
ncbi:hypothetical protein SAMN04515671_2846 [Nakamurella panacisegetis]|uniref:EVE domain-containing protein n=1 Tax=Nakamurella panacisegetis TaxID=1090615 RepID=A0A1H0PP33_9ACTN|nr:hypothetical protein SAMN04515671_2846 [Nakamurella panacisegetis]